MIRPFIVVAQSAILAGCAALPHGAAPSAVPYSAVQVIETVPGPFVNTIYVATDRERQDASLGGMTVTTIVRRDKGVAWLLMPGTNQYEEVGLDEAELVSVQSRFAGLERKTLGHALLDGEITEKFAYFDADGRQVAVAWISVDGITLRSEVVEDALAGKPTAVISLKRVRVEQQDASLFELPAGYTRVPAR